MHQACLSASFSILWCKGRPRQRWDGRSQSLTLQKAGVILWCKDARGSVGMGVANPFNVFPSYSRRYKKFF